MADNKRPTVLGRIVRVEPHVSLWQWFYDKIIAPHLVPLIAAIGVGSGGTMLTTFVEALKPYAPLSWGIAFMIFFIAALVCACLLAKWSEINARGRIFRASSEKPSPINLLDGEFTRQTIRIESLVHPMGLPMERKTFIECDFVGPGIIALSGCTFVGRVLGVGNVEFVEIGDGAGIIQAPNKCVMLRCTLSSCRFFNVVIAVSPDSAVVIRRELPRTPWLTEVRGQRPEAPAKHPQS